MALNFKRNRQASDASLEDWSNISKDFRNGGILIGNGFSQAVWPKFGYSSIYETACSAEHTTHPLTFEDEKVFNQFKTQNFETVLSKLTIAATTNKVYGIEHKSLNLRHSHIKMALGEAIRSVHVPYDKFHFSDTLHDIKSELRFYKLIYSTNYDLLLYWSIMSGNSAGRFKDFFWAKDDRWDTDEDPYFDISDTALRDNPTIILYLHGALFLYRDISSGKIRKFKNKPMENLLDISEVPFFITEGSSEDKLRGIRSSDYLSFAYDEFLHNDAPLVIFGHSLGESDQHLINAIRRSKRRKIAISLRSSNSPETIAYRKARLKKALCDRLDEKPEVLFFDSKTHPLGSEDINISESETHYIFPPSLTSAF